MAELIKYDETGKKLTIRGNKLISKELILDTTKGKLIKIFDANDCDLEFLPDFIAEFNPEVLFLSNNYFIEIPDLSGYKKLRVLSLKSCKIANWEESRLPQSLEWLIMTGNRITQIPQDIGQLINLRKVALAGNLISSIPNSIHGCQKIELFRISANRLDKQPDIIFDLPNLSRYGDGGNYIYDRKYSEKIEEISFQDITLIKLIGESPSSEVFLAKVNGTNQEIAVKLFRGELTSDGYPQDDMNCALIAGNHKNLIEIKSVLTNHPENKKGLILKLIDERFFKLGNSPSLESCTRDTFPDGTKYNIEFIINVLKSISLGAHHMHTKGVMHGDIYAHNILSQKDGFSLLGDFGAGSLYDPNISRTREKIDVSAFGCLIEDLLSVSNGNQLDTKLVYLISLCKDQYIKNRPTFKDIYYYLNNI